ncbi:tail tape measure protein [Marinobacter phage AS1]|nr:tail tape measure protein [Marinobacter phage AS1]
MATNQKQEVELLIKAGTEGLKSIGQLVKELEALGQDTGEASEKLEGLAGALSELRDQQKLVRQFADLKSQTKDLADQQAKAKDRATELGKALAQTEKPTRAQRNEFEKAKKASRDADQAWQNNQRELNGLRNSLSDAGISTRDLSSEQQRIKREIAGVDAEIGSVTSELTQMRDSAKAAAGGSRELGDDVQKSGTRVSKFRERLQGLNPILGKVGAGLKTAGLAVAGFVAAAGASVATLTVFSKGQAKLADELTNTSNAIGVNREQLQLWRIAGDRVGLSGEKVSDILRNVAERLGEFSRTGGGEAADVMDTLNLKIEEFRNLSPDEQLLKLGAAIGDLGSKSEQVALLEKLASDASQLQPLLEDNAAGLREIFEQAQQEGAIYSEEELNKLNRANDIYNKIDLKLKGLTARIGAQLAPAVGEATDKVVELFGQSGAGEALVSLFTRLSESAIGFLQDLSSNSKSIGESFSTLTNTLSFLGNTAVAVFRGAQSAAAYFLTFVATGIAGVMSAAQGLAFALNKVGVVSDSAYNTIAAKAEAARASVIDLQNKTIEYGTKAAEAGKAAIKAFEETGEAAKKSGKDAEGSVGTLTALAEDIETAGEAAEKAMRKQERATEDARKGLSEYGVDVKEVMTGITSEAQEAIDGVGVLASKIEEAGLTSEQSAEAFKVGFGEAIESVNTREGLTALQDKIKGLKEAGDIGAAGANEALETIRLKLAELTGLDLDLGLEDVPEDSDKAGEGIDKVKEKTKQAAEEAEKARDRFRDAWGAAFAKAISNARQSVTELSTAARNLFEEKIGGNAFVDESISASEALEQTRQRVDELASARRRLTGNSFAAWFADTALAAAEVKQEFYEQAVAIESLTDRINAGSLSLDQLDSVAARATNQFNLLDNERLQGLQSAIDAARTKIESLNSSAESTLNSLRQRLADISGDTEEAQRLQYEAERKRLQEQLEQARQAGADSAAEDYARALEQLEKINKIEQQNRREAENERERQAAERQRQQEQAERERQQFERQRSTTTNQQQSVQSRGSQTIILQTPSGERTEVQTTDPDSLLRTLEEVGLRSTS